VCNVVSHRTANRVPRRIFGPKKLQKTAYDEFPNLYPSPNIVRIINMQKGEYYKRP
jgi:hypothetical protein